MGGVYNCQSRWSETVQFTARVDKWRLLASVVRKTSVLVLKDTVETFHMGS